MSGNLMSGLDFYKLTMAQFAWENHPEAEVTFTFKNRKKEQNILERLIETNGLAQHVPRELHVAMAISRVYEALAPYRFGFNQYELAWLSRHGAFKPSFVDYLRGRELPQPLVVEQDGDLAISVTGPWPMASLWETVVMAEVNELYFSSEPLTVQTEGHMRLSEKILALRADPSIKVSEFGTRRRFSRSWQETVTRRLQAELPENFVGTSNPHLAAELKCNVIGTFAHELPMVYGGLAEEVGGNPLIAHGEMLDRWFETYGEKLSIALTDTFGSDFFFASFGEERARKWKGLRHDSGNPFEFGEKAIAFYESFGIDPRTKLLVFSDGLDLETIQKIHEGFNGRVQLMYGWGTGLTNDMGLKALSIVMKATHVNGVGTVKLSDDLGKHTGAESDVLRYQSLKSAFC